MFNAKKNMAQQDRLAQMGGVSTSRGVKIGGETAATMQPHQNQKTIRVYQPTHGQGPLSNLPGNVTFYDLITSSDENIVTLRQYSFEDWVFPTVLVDGSNYLVPPQRIIRRGLNNGPRIADEVRVMGQSEVVQYLYIFLNPSFNLLQSFGDHPGTRIKRSDYMVCVEVGDPRTGRLDNAFIQYALCLNTPAKQAATLSTTLPLANGEYQYLYNVRGDSALEERMFHRWFNQDDYYFNGVIYPKIRPFMDI